MYALDVAGDAGVLSLYRDLNADDEARLAEVWAASLGLEAVYLKRRPQEARHTANVQRDWLAPQEPVWGQARELTHWVAVGRDVTERKLADKKIKYLAFYDQLT